LPRRLKLTRKHTNKFEYRNNHTGEQVCQHLFLSPWNNNPHSKGYTDQCSGTPYENETHQIEETGT
jgi:hypothetical protein